MLGMSVRISISIYSPIFYEICLIVQGFYGQLKYTCWEYILWCCLYIGLRLRLQTQLRRCNTAAYRGLQRRRIIALGVIASDKTVAQAKIIIRPV